MDIRLYNSLTRKLETFAPLDPGEAKVYSCGPTVYGAASIGNFRAFLFADTLVRVLRYNQIPVRWVMNITDVGHLASDADEGEDKLQNSARKEGRTAWDVAAEYTAQFLKDLQSLNIVTPDLFPKATDHIEEQIALVQELEDNGYAYHISDGIYFDTSKLKNYGAMAGQAVEDKQEGARVEANPEKRHAADFALWKFSPKGSQRDMEWESPWGVGFHGWHAECTAMSMKYLGNLYDIHTGGMDLMSVHHPNEIAQAQGSRGTTEANIWMHNAFLQVDGGRMGKSLGNAYTIADVQKRGYDPLAFRYFFLQAHYRRPHNFTFEALDGASQALKRLRATVRAWETPAIGCAPYEERFHRAVNDDLDMPQALAVVWDMVNDAQAATSAKAQSLKRFDEVLGLRLMDYIACPIDVPPEVQRLLDERQTARVKKNYTASDRLRDQIAELGFVVEDTDGGQRISET